MPTSVLVTGAAGYIGSILCERLLQEGYRVLALDTLAFRQRSLFHLCSNPRFEFHYGDARDDRVTTPLVRTADVIIPLAALVGAPACDRDPVLARQLNYDAITLLLARRAPGQLLIYPTTNSGYGSKSGELHCDEETPLEPISLYGRTKSDAERIVLDSPHTLTFRLATVFGFSPRMRVDLLVNHFVLKAVTDGYLVVFEKHFRRNFIHVRDVSDCFVHAIERSNEMKGRPYNVGNDDANVSKEELANLVRERIPGFFVHFSEIGSDPDKRNYLVSNERLRRAGFEAKRSLDDGISELVKGYSMFKGGEFGNV